MNDGCTVCAPDHRDQRGGDCNHWCHFVDFDADTAPRGGDGQEGGGRGE